MGRRGACYRLSDLLLMGEQCLLSQKEGQSVIILLKHVAPK